MEKKDRFWITIVTTLLIAALIAALLLIKNCGGCAVEPGRPSDTDEPVAVTTAEPTETATASPADMTEEPTEEPTDAPLEVFVTPADSPARVIAIKNGTYGVADDGTIRFIGSAASEQNLIYDWFDVISAAANDGTAAALTKDGRILLTGAQKGAFAGAERWIGMVDIAMGDGHIVGLRTDGRVFAEGGPGSACDVFSWTEVKAIAAAGDFTAAITENEVLTTLGENADAALNAGGKPVGIAASRDRIAVLREDGRVDVLAKTGGAFAAETVRPDWTGIVKVFASEGAVYGVTADGTLRTDSPLISDGMKDVYAVAASADHAVALLGTGKCVGRGENASMQREVGEWRLLPYVTEDGWLMGLVPGREIAGEPAATGKSIDYIEPATGKKTRATEVVLGDVNGDGAVDNRDAASVTAHMAGDITLTGAFFRAANIVCDSAKPSSIDINDLERLQRAVKGERAIDPYGKTDRYTALLAAARRKNSDALGYITIDGTNISYPIMYDFNWYYNDHDIDRNEVVRGSIYFYWPELTGNTVITGHNSRSSGTMFHQLHKVQDQKGRLKTFKNRMWQINVYGETGWWEVWAMYEEGRFDKAEHSSQYYNTNFPNGFDSLSDKEKQAWIDYQLERTELNYSVNVTVNDRFITMTTCGDHHSDSAYGARIYFFLRWVGSN